MSKRVVLALVLIAALWQGPAWAYLNVAGVAGPGKPDAPHCSVVTSIGGTVCNDCCGGNCDPGCQSACGFLGAAAITLNPSPPWSFIAVRSQPIVSRRAAIITFDSAPPIRPPIP